MKTKHVAAFFAGAILSSAVGVAWAAPADAPAGAAPAATDKAAMPVPTPAPTVKEKLPAKPGALTGSWSGLVGQVGRSKQYPIVLTIAGKGGTTSYPEQKCAGKLTRVGSTGDYTIFSETINEGKFDVATKSGCLDGVLTLMRSGEGIVMGWLAGYEGHPVVAYGSLAEKLK